MKRLAIFAVVFGLLCIPMALGFERSDAPLAWGAVPQREACPDEVSYIWIEHAEGFDCIRYFSGSDLSGARVVIAMFSGDRDRMLKLSPEDIRNNTRRSREFAAAKFSTQTGFPVILVARPGTYGSSGDHRQRRQAREFLALDAALTAVRQRYGITQFVLLGHSGGATAAAALLTLGRDDIRCAVLTSGAFDLLERSRRRAAAQGRETFTGQDTTGLPAPFDPLYQIHGVRLDPQREIILLGHPLDTVTPFDLQKKFADALAAAGHRVALREAPARAPNYHDLLGNVGLNLAADCAREAI